MRGPVAELFRSADFRRVWGSGVANGATRWLEFTAVALFVFQQTGSPFLTALTATLRLVPMALFGPVMGTFADVLGARRVYLGLTLAMAVVFAVQAALALAGRLELGVVLVGCFFSGVYWSADFPVRRTLLGAVTGEALAGPALIQDSLANNVTRMLGPMLGGIMLSVAGIAGVMVFGVAASLVAFAFALNLAGGARGVAPAAPGRAKLAGGFVRDLRAGLQMARKTPATLLVLAITIVFNLFSFPTSSMVPVMGDEELRLSAAAIGLLASCEGIGATLGSVILSFLARRSWYRRILWAGLVLAEVSVLAFALAPGAGMAAFALFCMGLGVAGFSTMQTTLIYVSVPAAARGRMLGLVSFCVGMAPLGILNLGMLAALLGTRLALVAIACAGLLSLGVLALMQRRVTYNN